MWASDQIPLSWGEIRPSGNTAVASTNVNPGPREAIPPTSKVMNILNLIKSVNVKQLKGKKHSRCAVCQGVTNPSFAEY